MNNPFTKIGRLKNKLRKQYKIATSYNRYMDCGRHMAGILKPEIIIAERKFNKIADELQKLDDSMTNFRFPTSKE